MFHDLKFALRQLLKNPGFTVHSPQCCYEGQAVAALMLVLGIGANTNHSKGVTKP